MSAAPSPVPPQSDVEKKLDDLVSRTDGFLAKALGSPRKPKNKQEKKKKSARSARLTEREEDELILESAKHDLDDEEYISHLTVQPPNIKGGTMREYQLEGLNWMIQLYNRGLSGILADEMGLGKTLQSISLLAYLSAFRKVKGPHLVVVPLTTIGNWMREFAKWCPSIRTVKFHGDADARAKIAKEEMVEDQFDVCITSYEMASLAKAVFKKVKWHFLIVDEAHRLKNENSKLALTLRLFPSKHRLLLTGPPLQNNLHELWALLNFLLPDIFSSSEEFDEIFKGDAQLQDSIVSKLHKILRPFMLRRLKAEVEADLPPKVETLIFVGMSSLQKEVYRNVLLRDIDAINGSCKEKSRLLNIVMQLRKAANHPYLFEGIEDRNLDPYGEHLIFNAGKMVVLEKLLRKLQAEGSRVLIFSQMTRMLDILEDFCVSRKYEYCRIDGSTGTEEREERMEEYNKKDSKKFIFLLSTRAGGLGINLATANIVILFDSDWNPQMDLQAQDRAHRIGQKKVVRVYRFVVEGSIEEKIIERAEIKLRLDALVIQQGRLAQQSKSLATQDMQEMIRFGADKIFKSKDSTISDEDIDLILSRGQQRTAELNDKLKQHVGLKLSMNSNYYTLDDKDYSDTALLSHSTESKDDQFDLLNKINAAIPKRERKPTNAYDVDKYYKEALTAPKATKSQLPKPVRAPQKMQDIQFFNQKRINELAEKDLEFWEKYKNAEEPPALSGLSEEEHKEFEKLCNEGFGTWNRRHFQQFIRGCERFGRKALELITNNVQGKTIEEVKTYSEVFWKRYSEIKGHERFIKLIEKGEARLERTKDLSSTLSEITQRYGGIDRAREELEHELKTGPKKQAFTPREDVFLLCETARLGYGSWPELRRAVKQEPEFRFDYFLKSRTDLELSRRVDALLRLVGKNSKPKDEEASKAKKKRPAEATPSKGTAKSPVNKKAKTSK